MKHIKAFFHPVNKVFRPTLMVAFVIIISISHNTCDNDYIGAITNINTDKNIHKSGSFFVVANEEEDEDSGIEIESSDENKDFYKVFLISFYIYIYNLLTYLRIT